mgnify:CR=1 FL=1
MNKKIAIVTGEPNSVNSEIISKSWLKNKSIFKKCFLIGNFSLIQNQIKRLKFKIPMKKISDLDNIDSSKKIKIFNIPIKFKNSFSVSDSESKKYIKKSLKLAHNLSKRKDIFGFINCPIDKKRSFKLKNFGVTDYLAKLSLEALGYAGSNYQLAAIDFNGGDTAGAHNGYARIGCSSMNGANNQESGSLEFYVKDPSYNLSGNAAAMKICGKAGTQIAGSGQHRNGVLFPFMGIALDRTWANYPGIAVGNSSDYSTTASANSEFRVHGANFSSASYPGTSGADFSVDFRIDGAYQTGSDRRRKKNITTIDNALSTVKQLTGKKFQIVNRADEVQETASKNGYKFGFIAQDVESIIPETVKYNANEDDGTENWNSAYSLDYGSLTALLVNAIKEQDTVIQDLKSRIETLEG